MGSGGGERRGGGNGEGLGNESYSTDIPMVVPSYGGQLCGEWLWWGAERGASSIWGRPTGYKA